MAKEARQIRLVTFVGLGVNLILAALKFVVGIIGSSQAVVADAFHSLSDLSTDIAVLVGVKFWSAPPDDNHPFGHYRIETLITLGIGVALAFIAATIGYKAIVTIRDPHIEQPGLIAVVGPLVSIILKEILFHWTIFTGRRAKSPAVVANAWHHRSDVLSSVPALVAVVVSRIKPGLAFIDHIGALIVALFIMKVAWDISKPAFLELSGVGASEEEKKKIEAVVKNVKGVRGVHAVRTRKCGCSILLDLHVLVSGEMSVFDSHEISEEVKKHLIEDGPSVIDVVVHIEPNDHDND